MPETRLITKRLHDRPDDSWTIDAALATGAYDGLRKALTMTPAAIGQEQVKASGLRGRGGAGFPAATKWSFLPEGKHPRYLVVNDDEGEPSTFKDRMLTERDPHQLIEGIVIAAFAIESHLAFIYIRGEFALGYERLEQAVKDAYARGFLGKNILGSGFDLDVVIHRGAGAYICGEETGLLESLEGERGMPRIRPPFPAVEGLYAKPTVVNNVETLSALPHIIAMGGDKYAELGVGKSTGTRIFSLSGHVNRPGNYEVELGTTFRELIEAPDLGGGVPNGRSVKFFIPGGASSQWLTGEHLDVPLDMDVVQQEYGVMLGSGAVMVFDETVNPVLVAWRLAKFFAHESCGKCTPCREGTGWIEKVLYRIVHGLGRPEDLDLLVDVGDGISPGVVNAPFTQTTICPLGPSAVSAIASLNKYFRDEVMAMCNAPAGAEVPGVTNGNGERVKVTIDGKEIDAPAGELIIQVAQDHGIFIPRFCWHERMKPVGMCRMCLVEIDGQRGLPIACSTPVADGMVVHTRKDNVAKAQDAVLEFLLINHPLDCPVCDRGGECPLQDQTLAFGPGESRFVEEKRHFEKPIPISDLVLLDRERCIQCGRCTRFADEIAGDPLIDFGERGGEMQVITYPDEPFTSYFSGNTVQICPVGALTATPYRFKARPWDLATSETSCTACSVGCRGAVQSSSNRLVRLLGVDSEPVNQGWLCDKGRFGYEWVHSPDRVRAPMVRKAGQLVETSWPQALDAAAELLRRARDEHGPASIAVLGGARGTNEDAYAWARFAKGVLRTDHVDAQLGDGLPAEAVLGLPRATIPDCDRAAAIVLLAPDLKEELPVLFLRVRRAADELGVPLVDVAASDHGLTRYATKVVRHTPGGAAAAAAEVVDQVRDLVSGRGGPVVVVLGRPSLAEPPTATVHAAAALAALPDARFLSALRRGNVHGALDLGLTPGFLPGRVTLDAGRDHFTGAWGAVPDAPGLDATGILESAVQGQVQALVILGSNPMADFPDRTLARRALDHVDVMVAVGAFATDTSSRADVMLPTTVWGEKEGSTTNLEGRVLRVSQQVTPSGTPMADWRIATELALRLGSDFDLATVTEVQDEIAKVAPAHVGVDAVLLRRARDGVVLPVHEHGDDLVLDAGALAITDASWEPIRPGTIASEEGLASNVGTGVVEATGTGSTTTVKPGLTETEAAAAPGDEVDKVTGAAAAAAAEAPDRHRFDLGGDAAPAAVKRDAYALRLVVGRTLYDAGLITSQSPSLAPLAARPILLVNKKDFDRIGVAEGGRVRVTSTRGSVQLPVRPDVTTPEGVAFLAYNPTGEGAAELIDIAEPVTDVRVETLRS